MRVVVERWATGWFGSGHKVAITPTPGSSLRTLEWRGAAGARAGIKRADLAKLGSAAAGGHGDLVNRRDRAVFEQLGQQIRRSLAALFRWDGERDASTPGPEIGPGAKDACFVVTPHGSAWTLYLALGPVALTVARRGRTAPNPAPEIGTLLSAIDSEFCSVSGHLGNASLSSSELGSLTKGDVIMLDRVRTDPVPLLVNDAFPVEGTAKIESNASALQVRVYTPISLQTRSAEIP